MNYLEVAFLLAAGVAVLVGWHNIRRSRNPVVGSELIYLTDRNCRGIRL